MSPESLSEWLILHYPGLVLKDAYSEKTFFYNPGARLKNGTYAFTLKDGDGPNDKASSLNRDGVFRLSFGLENAMFESQFGPRPKRPAKGDIVLGDWDFQARNTLSPHPIYAWMGWVQILSPSLTSCQNLRPLLDHAYTRAKVKFEQRIAKMEKVTI